MTKLLILLILILPMRSFSQEFLVLKGKALDQKSKLPLPLATISIKNSSIGTMASEDGEFEFFVPKELKDDTLIISYLGYKIFKERVANFTLKNVFLEEAPTRLDEMKVTADGARKLMEAALNTEKSKILRKKFT